MNGEQIYNHCYRALWFFHWGLFIVVVEFMFAVAGWMICGLLGMLLAAILNFALGLDYSQQIGQIFPAAGKVIGVMCGVVFIRFIFARFIQR